MLFLYIVYILGRLVNSFMFMSFITIPVFILCIVSLICLIKNRKNENKKKNWIIVLLSSIIIEILLVIIGLFFGPKLFSNIIYFKLINQEDKIESRLEDKYGKDYTFVTHGKVYTPDYIDIDDGFDFFRYDLYRMDYDFKDEDGETKTVSVFGDGDYIDNTDNKYLLESKWD